MQKLLRITGIAISAVLLIAMMGIVPVFAQDRVPTVDSEKKFLFANVETPPRGSDLVQVNWIEEILEGGFTMAFLGLLSIALLAFLIERYLVLQRKNFLPPGLTATVRPLFAERRFDEILKICEKNQSVMGDIITHFVNFRAADFEVVSAGAADIGARSIADQEEKCAPLTVIAGVAPLLGLLGTMIGMIEAFKLVEVFGDEGGASLLAGSISKALITTAFGLVLAIPAILGFHWARRRVHQISTLVEIETEKLLKTWFLSGSETKQK